MKSEQELRQIISDMELFVEDRIAKGFEVTEFLRGVKGGLAFVLGIEEPCGKPGCREDHVAARESAIAAMRQRAAAIREKRAAREKASRQ